MANSLEAKAILELLSEREVPKSFALGDVCFKEQLAFIRDKHPWVTASCSRRSGKTEVCAIDLLDTALRTSGVVCLYITLTRTNAERLIWPKLLSINDKYKLGGQPNISKLSITFPNGSVIYLSGCNDKSELDKFRGLALKLVYIDEVQSFKSFIKDLIDEALAPTLADYAGSLKLLGTPAPLRSGFFWETIQSKAYSHHHWTFWQNPFIAEKSGITHKEIIDRELLRRGVSDDHPSVRREWFGEWTIDTEALVLKYDETKNDFDLAPTLTDYVISADIGHDDADAIAVIGWHKHKKECYLVEEFVKAGQGVTELAIEIEKRVKIYNPTTIVMDTGGLGKKIAEELRRRYQLPIIAAEKSRKNEYLKLLDDALKTKKFFARKSSRFAADSYIVEWDYDKSTSDRLVIKDEPHSDIVDAVLYGFRETLAWASEAEQTLVSHKDKKALINHTQKLIEEQLEREIEREQLQEQEHNMWATSNLEDGESVFSHFLNKRRTS